MHSSKEQQNNQAPHALGVDAAQLFLGALFGPVANMAIEVAQVASTLYEDRFDAAAPKTGNRTNGHEGGYQLGVKHSLGGSFSRAQSAQIDKGNSFDAMLPYWKRDAAPAPRFAA